MPDEPRLYQRRPSASPTPPADPGEGLNAEQAAAATHGDGPLLVIAGAGTGKTRTLIHRLAYLMRRGVPPERILLLTFTRRAALEMLERAGRIAGSEGRRVHGGTFHGTAHRLLRRFGPAAGLAPDFTILDEGDAEDLLHLSRSQLGYSDSKRRFPRKATLRWVYSRHVNTDLPVERILRDELPRFAELAPDFQRIFADYTERKAARNLVDYDDLLLFWALLLESGSSLADQVAGLYDHILVDEYQDTNPLQARILRGMCRAHQNITVVGDDAQSIYGFRGASFRNIIELPRQFPGTRVIALEENYRSTQPILDVTNTLISRATQRYTKVLWTRREGGDRPWLVTARDEQAQTRFVVDRVLELHEDEGLPLREIAVLVRAGYMSADLEIELTSRRIPFEKWGGLRFLEAAHVKDVLAFLRVLENPRDEVSWYRVLLLLQGIGEATARDLVGALEGSGWDTRALAEADVPPRARASHRDLVALLGELHRRPGGGEEGGDVAADIARVRALYDGILRDRYDRAEPRLADLEQLQVIAAGYPDRSTFLSALALEPPSATQDLAAGSTDQDRDALVISTVHSAKGREWDAVFLIWAADGWFPMARALGDDESEEEERRLMYVALTRPRRHLAVTYPLHAHSTRRGANYSFDQLSRFLDPGVTSHMERVTLAEDGGVEPTQGEPATPAMDLRAMLASRFRV